MEQAKRISFDEESHTYVLDGEQELISVTRFLELFRPDFDKEKWSKIKADQEGITQEEMLLRWKKAADDATSFGHKVHKYGENLALGEPLPTAENEKEKNYFEAMEKFFEDHLNNYKQIIPEAVLFDPEFKIGGTADLVAQTKDGKWFVLDYKTNKRIKTSNPFQKMFHPVSHLSDCEFNKYSLQMSLYARMLEQMTGEKVHGLVLVHLTNDGYELYDCLNLKMEISEMLKLMMAPKTIKTPN